jgi:isopenicillin N synthase-like dioxygenase
MDCFGKLKPVYLVVSAVFMRSSHFVFSCNGFRSTLHRVMPVGKERYSVVFFLDPNPDCNVKCLESCCSETCPPRYFFLNLNPI